MKRFFLLLVSVWLMCIDLGAATINVSTQEVFVAGSVGCFCRGNFEPAQVNNIAERGVCWNEVGNPTIEDNKVVHMSVSTKTNSFLCKITGLYPVMLYKVKAYIIDTDGQCHYGNEIEIATIPANDMTFKYNWVGKEIAEYAAIYEELRADCELALKYNNEWTTRKKPSTVHYNPEVPTANANYSGWINFGKSRRTGTVLHELNHVFGGGLHASWFIYTNGGGFSGRRTAEVVQFMSGDPSTKIKGDKAHFWPYGINGGHEDNKTDILYCTNVVVSQAFGEDGLIFVNGGTPVPSRTFKEVDGAKYYLKSNNSRDMSDKLYLAVGLNGALCLDSADVETMISDDRFAWYIDYEPLKRFYRFQNVGTGQYVMYNATGAGEVKLIDELPPYDVDLFQIMWGVSDVTIYGKTDVVTATPYQIMPAAYPKKLISPNVGIPIEGANIYDDDFSWLILTGEEALQVQAAEETNEYVNVLLNKPATASSVHNNFTADLAVDGDNKSDESRWISAKAAPVPHWIEVNIGEECELHRIHLYCGWKGWNQVLTCFEIQIWEDDNWKPVITEKANKQARYVEIFPEGTKSNKVRLYIPEVSDDFVRLYELEVMGKPVEGNGFEQIHNTSIVIRSDNDNLYISSECELKEVVLYGIDGRMITRHGRKVQRGETQFISLAHLPRGVYLVQVTSNEGICSQRIKH